MISVDELRRWLSRLSDDDQVFIDEGGLCLVAEQDGHQLEVGGCPLDDDEEDEEGEDEPL